MSCKPKHVGLALGEGWQPSSNGTSHRGEFFCFLFVRRSFRQGKETVVTANIYDDPEVLAGEISRCVFPRDRLAGSSLWKFFR